MNARLPEMPSDEAMATMPREKLGELRDQIGGDAMDVMARIRLLAELARDKLPNSTDEDETCYALELLLEQFTRAHEDSNRMFAFIEALLRRVETSPA